MLCIVCCIMSWPFQEREKALFILLTLLILTLYPKSRLLMEWQERMATLQRVIELGRMVRCLRLYQ